MLLLRLLLKVTKLLFCYICFT